MNELDIRLCTHLQNVFGESFDSIPEFVRQLGWPCGSDRWAFPVQLAHAMIANPEKFRQPLQQLHRSKMERVAELRRRSEAIEAEEKRLADEARKAEQARKLAEAQAKAIEWERKQREAMLQRIRDEHEAKVWSQIPTRFHAEDSDSAPNPEAFDFVEFFWDDGDNEDFPGLLLTGGFGVGKTHAAFACWRLFAIGNPRLRSDWISSPDLAALCKSKHLSGEALNQFDEVFKRLRKASGVVLLDDFGVEKATAAWETAIFSLIDFRTSWGLKTILTSNLAPDRIGANFTHENAGRIRRRLRDYFFHVDFNIKTN